jgi:hypothetical protein
MAQERLSRLQKWILINTYQKTTKKQLPDDWRDSQAAKYFDTYTKRDQRAFWLAIYRQEILANYFDLSFVNWAKREDLDRPWSSYFSKVGDDKKTHNKANVTLFRSIVNMIDKGLIEKDADKITLTKDGRKKAADLWKAASTKDLP